MPLFLKKKNPMKFNAYLLIRENFVKKRGELLFSVELLSLPIILDR